MIALPSIKPKILVIGDLIVDQYLWGKSDRISPEAPVQIVNISKDTKVLGGAGNVINNLCALGAKVDVLGVIGICDTSNELKQLLENIEIDTKNLVIEIDRITSKKTRVISAKQQVLRFDQESTEEISNKSQIQILDTFKSIVQNYEIILISDYGKGVLTFSLTQSLIGIANKNHKKVLVDPKGDDYSKYKGAYLLTPNKKEASNALKINIKDNVSLKKALSKLKIDCNLVYSVITLSDQGIAFYDEELYLEPTLAKEVFDVTGAGDTVLASLGFALACNSSIKSAIKFANVAAGVVVGKIGSATSTLEEIVEYESNIDNFPKSQNIKNLTEITKLSKELRAKGKKIVFTNGCFDLLHIGHTRYLETARNFGDVLIIGLNSDSSVKNLKGKNRPINTQIDRALILLALKTVDYVIIFDETDPYRIIDAIKPNTLVKGGDYKDKKVIGEDLVDELKIVEFIKDKSTSKIIQKITQQN